MKAVWCNIMVKNESCGYMLFSLLNAVTTPTATLNPTPTPLLVSIAKNTAQKSDFWETLSNLSPIIFGIAAFIVSVIAIIISIQQNKIANKLAVIDKAFEVYNFFMKEIYEAKFFLDRSEDNITKGHTRVANICYLMNMIFSLDTIKKFSEIISKIYDVLESGEYPPIPNTMNINQISGKTEQEKRGNYFHLIYVQDEVNEIFKRYRLFLQIPIQKGENEC